MPCCVVVSLPITQPSIVNDAVLLHAGGVWENDLAYKPFVAITLNEFRRNWQYNMLDKHYRKMFEDRAVYCEWDDHEVVNNWCGGR